LIFYKKYGIIIIENHKKGNNMKKFGYFLAGLDFVLVPLNIYLGITYGQLTSWITATICLIGGICILVTNN
jgi:hypothetical protein